MIKKISRLLLVACFSVFLTACGGPLAGTTALTPDNVARIHEDMSPSQVKAILGEPKDITEAPIPIVGGKVTTYSYRDEHGNVVTVIFKNNLMKEKVASFGK